MPSKMPIKKERKSAAAPRKSAQTTARKPIPTTVQQSAAKPVQKAKPIRRRTGGVLQKILRLLAKGPITRGELLKQGGFSQAALYLNLKVLRNEHLIEDDSATHQLRLTSMPSPVEREVIKAAPARKQRKVELEPPLVAMVVPRELHVALEGVLLKLSPIDRASEKLHVLQLLSRTTPDPVAEILESLVEDVLRLSAIGA